MELLAALAAAGAWLLAYVLSRVLTPPHSPAPLPTTGLGPESPAVAALLASGWKPGPEPAEATLADLVTRGHVELGRSTVHVTATAVGGSAYERLVLDHVRERNRITDLPFRDDGSAQEWHERFRAAVLAETRAAGLSRKRISDPVFTLLILLALATGITVGLLIWDLGHAAFPMQAALGPFAGLSLWILLIWISQDSHERYTPAGVEAAARWLGVRESLRDVADLPPSAVAGRGRRFAYAVALGVAGVAGLSLATGDRGLVWSSFGGVRRPIRITYPRTRPRYGLSLPTLLLGGCGPALLGAVFLAVLGDHLWIALPATLVLGFGLYLLARSIGDALGPKTITGEVLWRCTWRAHIVGDGDPDRPWLDYLAVDDGTGDHTVAWALRSGQAPGVREGDVVTIQVRPWSRTVTRIRS